MKNIVACLAVLMLLLTACQKEAGLQDPANPTGGTGNPGGTAGQTLLTKAVQVDGTDSVVYTFFYNAAGQLTQYNTTDGSDFSVNKIVRSANGIITQLVLSGTNISSLGLDSVVQFVFYNASSSRYTGIRSTTILTGIAYSDSTAFTYDAAGNLTSGISYSQSLSLPYTSYERYDYSYTGGNLTGEKIYDHSGNTASWDLAETFANTYDAKTNPLKLGVEAILLQFTGFFGPNNVNAISGTDNVNASNSYNQTYSYTYNSASKPTNATIVENPGSTTTALRYYYN